MRAVADDGVPGANAPAFHQAVEHIRIGLGEGFGRLRRGAPEDEHGSIDGIGQGSGHHQFAAAVGFLDQREMLAAIGGAPGYVIVHYVVEQEKVCQENALVLEEGVEPSYPVKDAGF